jgi:adenylate cyclase
MNSAVPDRHGSKEKFRVLVLDDNVDLADALSELIADAGYDVIQTQSVAHALERLREDGIDLVISDVRMPEMSGYDFCRAARAQMMNEYVPIILLTGELDEFEIIKGLDAGADDFLLKPARLPDLIAKMRSLLRIRSLQNKNLEQAKKLAEWNRDLHERVNLQVVELNRLERLKRYFSQSVAELIVSDDFENRLKSHRKIITALFVDLRRFTAFAESVEPEEVSRILSEFYSTVGSVSARFEVTVGNIAGDGILFFFNDPIDTINHREKAVEMALELRKCLNERVQIWTNQGYNLGFGIGLAEGEATIGGVGFQQFWTYTVVGSTVNLASRLCSEANDGEILISDRFRTRITGELITETRGKTLLKGFSSEITIFNIKGFVTSEQH